MGAAMDRGMVLTMSLWDDHQANCYWLDSTYPVGASTPGAARYALSLFTSAHSNLFTEEPVPTLMEAALPILWSRTILPLP